MLPGDLFSPDFEDSHGCPRQLAQGVGSYPLLFLSIPTEMVILDLGLAEWTTRRELTEEQVREASELPAVTVKDAVRLEGEASSGRGRG